MKRSSRETTGDGLISYLPLHAATTQQSCVTTGAAMRRPRKAVIGATGSLYQEDIRYAVAVRSHRKAGTDLNRRKTAMRRPRKAVIGAKGSPHQEDNRYAITVRSYRKGHMLTADGAQVVAQLLDSHTRHRHREETRSRQRTTHTRPPDEDITRD